MEKVIGFKTFETIGVAVINPRATVGMIDPYKFLSIKIKDFCYKHSSKESMREFIGKNLIKYPQFAGRIKDDIIKICPQYKDMIDKLIVLI